MKEIHEGELAAKILPCPACGVGAGHACDPSPTFSDPHFSRTLLLRELKAYISQVEPPAEAPVRTPIRKDWACRTKGCPGEHTMSRSGLPMIEWCGKCGRNDGMVPGITADELRAEGAEAMQSLVMALIPCERSPEDLPKCRPGDVACASCTLRQRIASL
jgi:hypothetical protein